jgi:hypothetical protein
MTTATLTDAFTSTFTGSAILGTPRPKVFLHGDFQPGLGLLPKEVASFYKKHGRILILTGPAFISQTVASLKRMGIQAVGLTQHSSMDLRKSTLDAFNASEAFVLVVSAHWAHGWNVDANCIVMTGLQMPGLFKHVSEVAARATNPAEIHFIDCRWPLEKQAKMLSFFEKL